MDPKDMLKIVQETRKKLLELRGDELLYLEFLVVRDIGGKLKEIEYSIEERTDK